MKQLGQTAKQIPSPNFPIHRHNLDPIAFPYHCAVPAEFGQRNTRATSRWVLWSRGEYARPVADVNRSGHRQTRGFFSRW